MEEFVSVNDDIVRSRFFERTAVAEVYAIAGRLILFESQCGPVPGLERLLSRLHLKPTDDRSSVKPHITIKFCNDSTPPPVDAHFAGFEISNSGKCHTDGATYVFDLAARRAAVHAPPSSTVEVWLGSEPNLFEAEQAQLLFYAISTALRRWGLFELHSSAVITPEEIGILLVGPSGSGKSTLTLQLAANDWKYLTDDALLLNESAGIIEAYAFRRSFAVTRNTLEASGHAELQDALLGEDWLNVAKRQFTPHDFFPAGFVSNCYPRAMFFTSITYDARTRVQKLSGAEAMMRLVKMCPWSCYDRLTGQRHLRLLAKLANQCAAFELLAGREVIDDSAAASRIISREIHDRPGKAIV